jgi:hypothetical protein
MKTFFELNSQQRDRAVEFARSELDECVRLGLIFTTTKDLDDNTLWNMACDAAEASDYTDEGKVIRKGINQ